MANDASSVLSVARAEIGYSRYADPEAGTKYGRWYAQDHGSYYGTTGVPYCAMFVSWVFAQAGATCAGLPEAYCPYIRYKARPAGALLSDKRNAQPGDVILFDWGGDTVEDHVGIVEVNVGSYVQTIEGNVSGAVARRTRAWSDVTYVVRPSWGSSSSVSTTTDASRNGASLLLDCDAGKLTVQAWAKQLGLSGSAADGWINHQYAGNRPYLKNLSSVIYAYDGTPSPFALALQKRVGSDNLDGILGKVDVQNVQNHMNVEWGYHMLVDGIFGPTTAYNVQHSLNLGLWW